MTAIAGTVRLTVLPRRAPSRRVTVASSEEGLVELLANEDPVGIEQLYDRYGRLAYSLAYRVLNDEGAAEDVVQEAFLSVWRRAATYRADKGSLRTWVCSIVQHRALDRLRGRAGRARQDLPIEHAAPETDFSDTWDQVAEHLERDQILQALSSLTDDQRQTIELAYYGGYSQSEISSLLRIPLGTVKGRTRSALRHLRESLESRGWVTQ
ncbi:MAG: sigma-70 family RNA polymerase sigma factor [Candidatus Dormibacteria bacterium]